MKNFWKSVLATIVGITISCIVLGIFGIISLVGMLASGNSTPSLDDNSVLVMNLQGTIEDQAQEDNILSQLTGNTINDLSLSDMVKAIKKAKTDDHIKGIYIQAGVTMAQPAIYQELHDALADFKKSGKWIIAYGDRYSQGAYYVCSTANKIYINPEGMLDWHGLGSQLQFNKDLYAKFGVKYIVAKVGKFKSYAETYTEEKMSDANRQQVNLYLNGIWQNMLTDVSKDRKINKDSLNNYANNINIFADPKLYLKDKFVDGYCYEDEIKDIVKKQLGIKTDDKISQVSVSDVNLAIDDKIEGDKIAIYYCQGQIVQIAPQGILTGDEQNIVAKDVCQDLEDMAKDDDIKAIVLRINSGGGDAYASEQIWHEVQKLNKKKPVVVSMSGLAASGAYYMSMGSRWIVADPTTLTGSIGIFALVPDISGLLTQKLGIKFDEVKTNRNSNFEGIPISRPFNAEEMASLQGYVNRGYVLFRQRVADGRKLKVDDVEKIAQGHVWLGKDAIKIKLIDQLGNLDDAIKKAAEFAKLKDYYTANYKEPMSWYEQLLNASDQKNNYLDEQLRLTLGDLYEPFMRMHSIKDREALQAVCPYSINIKN